MATSTKKPSKVQAFLKRAKEKIKELPAWVVIVAGSVSLAIGVVLLIIPGPGIPFVALGVTLLASKIPWVAKAAHVVRKKFSRMRRKFMQKKRQHQENTAA